MLFSCIIQHETNMIHFATLTCLYNTIYVFLHSEFADEGILGYLDLELDLLRFIHCVRHTACDDGCGVATGDRGVYVEAVYIHILFLLRHQIVQ